MNEAFLVENAQELKVNNLPYDKEAELDFQDLYVMDWYGNWTYIITHENDDLGPCFIRKN